MLKKILISLLCVIMIISMIVPAFAETGVSDGVGYVGDPEGEVEVYVPGEEDEYKFVEDEEDDEDGAMVGEINNEDFVMSEYGTNSQPREEYQTPENGYYATEEEEFTGEGVLNVTVDAPEGLYETVLVELYNRDTGEIVQVPVYAMNEHKGQQMVASGDYMVSNVLVTGDDRINPKWQFDLGELIEIRDGKNTSLTVVCTYAPEQGINPNETTPIDPTEGVTDTDINKDNTEQPEELTMGQRFLKVFKSFFDFSDILILLVMVGSGLGLYYIKKKKNS